MTHRLLHSRNANDPARWSLNQDTAARYVLFSGGLAGVNEPVMMLVAGDGERHPGRRITLNRECHRLVASPRVEPDLIEPLAVEGKDEGIDIPKGRMLNLVLVLAIALRTERPVHIAGYPVSRKLNQRQWRAVRFALRS